MDKASEAIYSLKPVSFRYKKEIEPTRPLSFGLIAEDVEQVNPDLVLRGNDGKLSTVRYDAVNAMLLNEFLKEHNTVQEQGQELQRQAVTIAKQQKQIEALTSDLQKVSGEVQIGNPARQVVLEKP